jgi:two-component system sensor kinase FixL
MRFLAREGQFEPEVFAVEKLIEEAFQDAMLQQPMIGAQLKLENSGKPFVVTGDRAALKHALSEIMLNALQANPRSPQIGVKLQAGGSSGDRAVTIEVQDTGGGFSVEAAKKVTSPFYTTRNVGLGLGLAVSQKIIETHHGKLEIIPSPSGLVRISLPAESAHAGSI